MRLIETTFAPYSRALISQIVMSAGQVKDNGALRISIHQCYAKTLRIARIHFVPWQESKSACRLV
jgi:hypothetical protein